jgi:hypothetical protein
MEKVLIGAACLGIIAGLALLVRAGVLIHRAVLGLTTEVRELRLTSRTRVATASMRSGAATEEHELRRLGRASSARRIVVGGDDDSQLNKELDRASHRGQVTE